MKRKKKAVIIVDMQNDFLTKDGLFKDKYIKPDEICKNINHLIDNQEYQHIVFIMAEYDNNNKIKKLDRPIEDKYKDIPMNDDFLSGSHDGKKNCCIKGSYGAKLYDGLHINENHKVITKKFYSAFTDTELHNYLKTNNIKTICVTGVATHVCVLATVTDAYFLGYNVIVNSNCVSSTNLLAKETALSKIEKYYGRVIYNDVAKIKIILRKWINT